MPDLTNFLQSNYKVLNLLITFLIATCCLDYTYVPNLMISHAFFTPNLTRVDVFAATHFINTPPLVDLFLLMYFFWMCLNLTLVIWAWTHLVLFCVAVAILVLWISHRVQMLRRQL